MAYTRVKLIDPAFGVVGNLGTYVFDVGYNDEGEFGQRRSMEAFANTSGNGFIVQQGQDEPMTISISGTILKKSQHIQFVNFFKRSKIQSMVFEDFEGNRYEVMITAYLPKRTRAARNDRGRADGNLLHYYTYTLEMMVLSVISGEWLAA